MPSFPLAVTTATALRGADLPPVTREGAREAARRELSKQIYHRYDEPLTLRVLRAVGRWLDHALSAVASHSPGGVAGLIAFVALIVVAVVALRLRMGAVQRTARAGAVFGGRVLTAADHRAAADRYAAEGSWAEAVRERLRAVVRELEARGVLDPRPGRTADEVAREAGAVIPELAEPLAAAATVFDEVWYGGRVATAESHERLRRLDDEVRGRRLSVVTAAAVGPAVPR
jgi:hypothetical protein